ncbi:MAG TPA: ribosome maturation factor RimP [Streptosporangiaceae bacterium]
MPGAAPAGHRNDAEQAELARVLEPVVHAAGADLESIRISAAGRRRLLRVYVDADGGLGLDKMALISRELSARLDATGAMGEAPYTLEVSSPGVDRPLTQPRHWRRAAGRLVQVPVTAGDDGHSPEPGLTPATARPPRIEGRVVDVSERGITLDIGGERREFCYAELGPGRVQVEFGRLTAEPGIEDAAPAAAPAGPRTRGRADGH